MGLTRLAQDPWSESHTVPTFSPLPVEVKSSHVPLTAERAEELVKTHLERVGQSFRQGRDLDAVAAEPRVEPASNDETHGVASSAPVSCICAQPPASMPNRTSSFKRPAYVAVLQTRSAAGAAPPPPPTLRLSSQPGGPPMGDTELTGVHGEVHPMALDVAVVSAAMREAEAIKEQEENTEEPQQLHNSANALASMALSRQLSCSASMVNVLRGPDSNVGDGQQDFVLKHGSRRPDEERVLGSEPEDALEPLANHHMWMYGRGRMDGGGQGVLYSPAGVLTADAHGDGLHGKWQPRDAASIFGAGVWDATGSTAGSGSGAAVASTRIGDFIQEGATHDAVRSLAAVIIQSYCRGWQVRRRAAHMQSLLRSEESRRRMERAAAEALAREREAVRRRLRSVAKDCLFAVQAQQDYERARTRLSVARGMSSGAGAAPPPPPPTIPTVLWERCKALGEDPIEVLLESGLRVQQLEEIIEASHLASQLPRRAVAVAAQMGVPLSSVPEANSRPPSGSKTYGDFAATASMGGKSGSSSDDGGSRSVAAAAATGDAPVMVSPAMPRLMRRLSLPGKSLLPYQRFPAAGPPPRPLIVSASQFVEQWSPKQQQQQPLAYGIPTSANASMTSSLIVIGPAVRRSSGPGAFSCTGAPPLRRQSSPIRGFVPPILDPTTSTSAVAAQRQTGGVPPVGPYINGGTSASAAMYVRNLSQSHMLPTTQPHPQGPVVNPVGPRTNIPLPLTRATSRRMSDFMGAAAASNGGAVQVPVAPAVALPGQPGAAVGLEAAPPSVLVPVHTRSPFSDSGDAITALPSGQSVSQQQYQQKQNSSGRLVLPAVRQTCAKAAMYGIGAGDGSGGVLSSEGKNGSGGMPYYLPPHLSVGSTASSPVNRSDMQSSLGGSPVGSPALLRRHSFVLSSLSVGVGSSSGYGSGFSSCGGADASRVTSGDLTSSGPNSLLTSSEVTTALNQGDTGFISTTVTATTATAMTASVLPHTASPAILTVGGEGGISLHLPPLLLSQVSGGGSGSGAASPSAIVATVGSPNGAVESETALRRVVQRVSNLAPQGSAILPMASPPPGPPPTATPKSFRRLQSWYSVSNITSPSGGDAAASQGPSLPLSSSTGGSSPGGPTFTRAVSLGRGSTAAVSDGGASPPPDARLSVAFPLASAAGTGTSRAG